MRNNVSSVMDVVETGRAFLDKFEKALAGVGVSLCVDNETRPILVAMRHHAADLGEVFGRRGWKRKHSYGTSYAWTREVDGVLIHISDAEEFDMNDSEVPERDFPIQIKDRDVKVESEYDGEQI